MKILEYVKNEQKKLKQIGNDLNKYEKKHFKTTNNFIKQLNRLLNSNNHGEREAVNYYAMIAAHAALTNTTNDLFDKIKKGNVK